MFSEVENTAKNLLPTQRIRKTKINKNKTKPDHLIIIIIIFKYNNDFNCTSSI